MTEPAWLVEARRYIGQSEVPGKGSNPFIARLWMRYANVWAVLGSDDSTAPWCGMFVDHCLRAAGLPTISTPYRAKAWLGYGTATPVPIVGSLVIFSRVGGGHVGFVVGKDETGRLMVLGGNQKDRVSIAPFDTVRVDGYRWPERSVWPVVSPLPRVAANGVASSSNEA